MIQKVCSRTAISHNVSLFLYSHKDCNKTSTLFKKNKYNKSAINYNSAGITLTHIDFFLKLILAYRCLTELYRGCPQKLNSIDLLEI